ncbi:helix-turn-helix transcriptional regulator [Limimaricola pyoseonensis]|uniref:DNA-binding transcriptional regulator, CsgD family n=1 Tax=Limimaricola pyoseonensis TaxID=521013 RepID=A0A1G7AFK8_9RHOB|nr:helix-turn-helix transcriptional regulator [Limimaricola pyoseonensis]SDE13714.1 DNA-binding transcriptional regulator, CsgD family [Limimaricola pyoseonensis]
MTASHDLDHSIETLVDLIYQCAIEPSLWLELPGRLSAAAGGGGWALQLLRDGPSPLAVAQGANFDPDLWSRYPEHFAGINPWLPRLMQAPVMHLLREADVLDPEVLRRGRFYADFLLPLGDMQCAVGSLIERSEQGVMLLTSNFAPRHEEALAGTTCELIQRLAPHLRRALDLSRLAERSALRHGSEIHAALNSRTACFMLDHKSRLLQADPRGEALLSLGEAIRLGPDRRLRFRAAPANAALDAQLASGGRNGNGFRVAIGDGNALLARLVPLPRRETPGAVTRLLGVGEAVAALIVVDSRAPVGPDAETLRQLFQLTPAETSVAQELAEGLNLREIAALRDCSVNTVRNQLRSVLCKTGTTRQAELVALLARQGV